jgi:hypothetical protein
LPPLLPKKINHFVLNFSENGVGKVGFWGFWRWGEEKKGKNNMEERRGSEKGLDCRTLTSRLQKKKNV